MIRFAPVALVTSLSLLLFSAPTAATLSEVSVRLDPLQPVLGEDFRVIVEGLATDVHLVDVTSGPEEFNDGTEIRITLRDSCTEACSLAPFAIAIPIDASSVDLPEDDHAISVRSIDGMNEEDLLLYKRFAVGQTYSHPLPFSTYVHPRRPTDNEKVRFIARTVGNVCGPSAAEFKASEVIGDRIHVFLRYFAGFGGGFFAGTAAEKCTPPAPYDDADLGDLGQLDAGTYHLDVFIEELNGDFGTLPIRTRRTTLTVSDAPDLVGLQEGRFETSIDWRDFEGRTGVGKPVPGASDDSTLFSFFGGENWEVLVKVLEACTFNGKYWVFTSAATTVEYEITVEDKLSGEIWTYANPLGSLSPAVADTEAFDCSP